MPNDIVHTTQVPIWSVIPNETDWLAWSAIIAIGLAVYFVMYLYASFDRWAEHRAEGTVLAKTIPTLLGMALLYEIFPLDHFSILLPLSAILIAAMADWMAAQAKHESSALDQVSTVDIELEPDQTANIGDQDEHESAAVDKNKTEIVELELERTTNV